MSLCKINIEKLKKFSLKQDEPIVKVRFITIDFSKKWIVNEVKDTENHETLQSEINNLF